MNRQRGMNKDNKDKAKESFAHLLEIMDELRTKCPWDRKQTMLSLKPNTIEEVYELAQAVEEEDYSEIKKELGDLLLHVVFYAKIADEKGAFDINDVTEELCGKLIRRHPHIYGDVKAETAQDVKKTWEQIKMTEGRKSVFSGVPKALDAIIKAYRIQEKAAGVGFDWKNTEEVWEKVEEEIEELHKEVETKNSKEKISEEFGDVLFAMINYSRFIEVSPEHALEQANRKFMRRFEYMERQAAKEGKRIQQMTIEQMEDLWCEAKQKEKQS